jgi:hypothetical protein
VLILVLAKGYLARLLDNEGVQRYLKAQHVDLLEEFQVFVDTITLQQPAVQMPTETRRLYAPHPLANIRNPGRNLLTKF